MLFSTYRCSCKYSMCIFFSTLRFAMLFSTYRCSCKYSMCIFFSTHDDQHFLIHHGSHILETAKKKGSLKLKGPNKNPQGPLITLKSEYKAHLSYSGLQIYDKINQANFFFICLLLLCINTDNNTAGPESKSSCA